MTSSSRAISRRPIQGSSGSPFLPPISRRLRRLFSLYARWYLSRHFHALRLAIDTPPPPGTQPTVVFLNHASWWDPLVCLHLAQRYFPHHDGYAPIDAQALRKYPFFRRLGFFGVESDSPRGAATFLRVAHAVLQQPKAMLWVTPQGRFADTRQRPLHFKPGLGHLAAHLARHHSAAPVRFLPLALDYTFWEERLPEVLLRFGPHSIPQPGDPTEPAAWTQRLELSLEGALDALALAAHQRRPDAFSHLLDGTAGVGGLYDLWRRTRAALGGRAFNPRHGSL